jgi:hypothetical protein
MALTSKPDSDGDYIWEKEAESKGEKVLYHTSYFPRENVIGIAKTEWPFTTAIVWWGVKKIYLIEVFMYGRLFTERIIKEEEAIKLAYEFFREIVSEKLI